MLTSVNTAIWCSEIDRTECTGPVMITGQEHNHENWQKLIFLQKLDEQQQLTRAVLVMASYTCDHEWGSWWLPDVKTSTSSPTTLPLSRHFPETQEHAAPCLQQNHRKHQPSTFRQQSMNKEIIWKSTIEFRYNQPTIQINSNCNLQPPNADLFKPTGSIVHWAEWLSLSLFAVSPFEAALNDNGSWIWQQIVI